MNDNDNEYLYTIQNLISLVVWKSLSKIPEENMTREQHFQFTQRNFQEIKQRVQESVSAGVQEALESYSGKRIDYICQIVPMPPPINVIPC